jgi:hypothetical protein
VAVLALSLAGCRDEERYPGDRVLGTYRFETTLVEDRCQFDKNRRDPGAFAGTVSLDSSTGEAFLTVGRTTHRGRFDGARLTVESRAVRELPAPCGCRAILKEHVEGYLVTEAQASQASSCEGLPSDGGTVSDAGTDFMLICGFLTDEVTGLTPACECEPCVMAYSLSGRRQ